MNRNLNICQTCLSADRNLYPLQLLRHLLFELDMEEIKEIKGGVCWECRSIMRKFLQFKEKVRKAQDICISKINRLNSLSTLVTSHKSVYDFEYDHSSPQVTKEDEHVYIKQETETFEYDSDEEKPLIQNVNIYIEAKRTEDEEIDESQKEDLKNENSPQSKDVSRDVSNKECVDESRKYEKIVMTKEDVEKTWLLKRSNRDFQKMKVKCLDCVIGFNSSKSYGAHVRKKHDENVGPFCCAVCKVRFQTEFQMNRHTMLHYRCYKCKLCDFKSPVLNAVLIHYSVTHCEDANGLQCKKCQLVVDTLEQLNDHTNKMHKLACNLCEKIYKGKSSLRKHHKKMHNSKRGFVCDVCSKSFTSKTRLETHMVTHDKEIAKRLAYCAKCDLQYKNIHVYRDHLRKSGNHSEEPFQCPDCDKKFASKVYWRQHNNYFHLKKSQFKCEICNKVFISFWKLHNHNQKHHGIARPRNYPCTECSKKFFTMEMLKNHRQIHSNERPFMCTDCGKTFKQSAALFNHTRIIHQGYKRNIRVAKKADNIK